MARRPSRRAVCWVVAATVGFVLLTGPLASADSDLFSNIGPASQVPRGALMDAYPLGHYQLDHHFSAVKAGLLSGVDVSGIPPTIAIFLANILWQITAFMAQVAITVFTFAFSLDLLGGSSSTGGAGALEPVSRAVRSIYDTTFGAPWLVVAILLAGLWAIWHALVRRRYTETAGSLALSVVFVVVALAFVAQPERTIGSASRLSNAMSGAFLSLTSRGVAGDHAAAKRDASDQLFSLLVYQPWAVLQFGGLEHCVRVPVDKDDPVSVAVRPLSSERARDAALSERLRRTGQVDADSKTCMDAAHKYAPHFLRFGPDSDQRKAEYEAIRDADTSKLPDEDPGKKAGDYRLSAADKPAADAMGKGAQYQRLLLAIVIFVGELGAVLLLGALSLGVILAQVLVLLLLAFAPIVLVIAVIPGRGHAFFMAWLSRLAAFLLRKAIYSLVLAVLLTVAAALQSATAGLGWLLAWGLQAAFFWTVLLSRRQLLGQLTQATTGPAGREDGALRLAAVYGALRATRQLLPGRNPTPPPPTGPSRQTAQRTIDDRDQPPAPPPAIENGRPAGDPETPADERPKGTDTPEPDEPPAPAVRPTSDQNDEQRRAATQPFPAEPVTAGEPSSASASDDAPHSANGLDRRTPQPEGPDHDARIACGPDPSRGRDTGSSPAPADERPHGQVDQAGQAPSALTTDRASGPDHDDERTSAASSPLAHELDRDTAGRHQQPPAHQEARRAAAPAPQAADGAPAETVPPAPRSDRDLPRPPAAEDQAGPAAPPEVPS